MKEETFLAEARKRNLSITHRDAKEVQALAARIVDVSPEFIAKVKAAAAATREPRARSALPRAPQRPRWRQSPRQVQRSARR